MAHWLSFYDISEFFLQIQETVNFLLHALNLSTCIVSKSIVKVEVQGLKEIMR